MRDHRVDRRAIANAAADLDRQRRRRDDLADQRVLLRRARERAVEIDDVQAIRAIARELRDELDRPLAEHGRAIAAALFEAHGLAAEQIDRGIQLHVRLHERFAAGASPTAWLFSGWN